LTHERAHDLGPGGGRFATVDRLARGVADGDRIVEREAAGAGVFRGAADGPGAGLGQVLSGGELREDAPGPGR